MNFAEKFIIIQDLFYYFEAYHFINHSYLKSKHEKNWSFIRKGKIFS